ncbi:MAG: hypothetical protein HN737_01885 [Desulfobacterales bacterium]|jgi:peptidyl-prolyl cis-trans isomerase D|nr:hypothetical protein [Desulfobacteraceae bacterium]MBT4363329.1 hypothetical protein [Desulfobacteraceae bacterium]MBT7084657.1 hypothetical protein [Desulfobacterales bacterium]MBT7696141.1 hypothetical protein [Desulfobacterales bacterium]
MLRKMRENASSWIIKVLLGLIVVVFVLMGTGGQDNNNNGKVVTVNGESILYGEYRSEYFNMLEQYRKSFGDNLDDKLIKLLRVEKNALDQLINRKVILQEAKKLKLKVSDKELNNAIKDYTAFKINGKFDIKFYKRILAANRMTPEKFETDMRKNILTEKLRKIILSAVKVSDNEALEWYKWSNSSVNIDTVLFSPDKYKDINPSEEEIKKYFDDNKDRFKTESKIKVRYLKFNPDSYKSNIKMSADAVKDYYEADPEKYIQPKTVEARHILIKVEQGAEKSVVEEKRKKAADIAGYAKEGKDFAELAKKYSEGPSKDKGGDLGAFTEDSMVKPFADKAFSMKPGEVSDPVKTQFGWHIIKVEKVNEKSMTSLKDATPDILNQLMGEEADRIAYDEAIEVLDISEGGNDLLQAADERKMKLVTTDFITRNQPQNGVKEGIKFTSTAFELIDDEVSDVYDFGNGYYILQVADRKPEVVPPLEDIKAEVTVDLKNEQQDAKAKEDAESFLKKIKAGDDIKEEAGKNNLEIVTTGLFKRDTMIPKIGSERNVAGAAFKLSEKNNLNEEVIKGEKGYFVIKFRGKEEPPLEDFDKDKAGTVSSLRKQKESEVFSNWLSQLVENSEIEYTKDFENL